MHAGKTARASGLSRISQAFVYTVVSMLSISQFLIRLTKCIAHQTMTYIRGQHGMLANFLTSQNFFILLKS